MAGDTLIEIIADILISIAAGSFLLAELKQYLKIRSGRYKTDAISRSHLKLKIIALACIITGYCMAHLWMSLIVSITQLLITIGIVINTYRYYDIKHTINQSISEVWDNPEEHWCWENEERGGYLK